MSLVVITMILGTPADLVRPHILLFSMTEWDLGLANITNESAMKFYTRLDLYMLLHIKISNLNLGSVASMLVLVN